LTAAQAGGQSQSDSLLPEATEDLLTSLTTQDLAAVFSFPFRGTSWKQKLMLGSVMAFLSLPLLLIPSVLIAGYTARILRQVLDGQDPHLPEWDDWSQLLNDGLRICTVNFIIMLPLIVTMVAGYTVMAFSPILVSLLNGPDGQSGAAFTLVTFTTFGSGIGMLLGMLISLVASMLLPVAITHMIAHDSFSAAFDLRGWWPILRFNLGEFALIATIVFGASMFFSMILQFLVWTILICWLLPVLSGAFGFTVGLIANAMYARAYREGAMRAVSSIAKTV
jgi:hypothetical protein